MLTKYLSPARMGLLALLSILLLLGLTACGADNTPTTTTSNAPATTAAVTATSTTSGPGPAVTTNGTASAATGAGSFTDGKFSLPGTTLLTLDPGVGSVLKGLLSSGATAPDMALQIYASDNETPILGENADSALVKAGYVFHDVRNGSDTRLIVNGNDGAGAYTKAGGPDVILYAREANALTGGGTPPGIDATQYQKLVAQLQGKKSVLIVLTGTNLFQALANTNSTPVPTQ
jgi:hypothetical protein